MKTNYEIVKIKTENIGENLKKSTEIDLTLLGVDYYGYKLWKSNIYPAAPEPEK